MTNLISSNVSNGLNLESQRTLRFYNQKHIEKETQENLM